MDCMNGQLGVCGTSWHFFSDISFGMCLDSDLPVMSWVQ